MSMRMQNIVHHQKSMFISSGMNPDEHHMDSRISCTVSDKRSHVRVTVMKPRILCLDKPRCLNLSRIRPASRIGKTRAADENQREEYLSDEDEDLCPVDCVREFKTDEELLKILDKAKETRSLVVVDFFRTSCGSCKYIEQGFAKLCRGSGDQESSVIFLKHNVIDEYDEQSEVAHRLRIKTVPLFHFYKDGVLLEAFPTRDRARILEAIRKYTSSPAS